MPYTSASKDVDGEQKDLSYLNSQTGNLTPSSLNEESPTDGDHGESSRFSRKRETFSHHLPPLQVAQRAQQTAKADQRQMTATLSIRSERILSSRIEELSQLESPLLRELARRLADKYQFGKTESPAKCQHPYAHLQVGQRWEEIQGSHRWSGLLDPLDPVLRAEMIRYGEFAQATYDAFDGDPNSKYCGSSKYTKKMFFEQVALENRGYEITDFLYATTELNLPHFFSKSQAEDSWSKDSNWMGFVAVCTSPEEIARLGRRDILVAWRGTQTKSEWIADIQDYLAPAGLDTRPESQDVMVESGFLSVYKSKNEKSRYNKTSAREQVLQAVKSLVEKYKHEGKMSITVTGHSLGSALATLCGYDIAESKMNLLSNTPTTPTDWAFETPRSAGAFNQSQVPLTLQDAEDDDSDDDDYVVNPSGNRFRSDRIPVTVYSFAGPRVGNLSFRKRVEELGVAVLRVVNVHDLVPKVPGYIFTGRLQKILWFLPSYKHVGVKLRVNHQMSPFLRNTRNFVISHNLEGYLHLVDGFAGPGRPFQPNLRDFALVNKGGDFLKPEYFIPPRWWQEKNKGIVRDKNGHWVLPPRDPEIYPRTPNSITEGQFTARQSTSLEPGDGQGQQQTVMSSRAYTSEVVTSSRAFTIEAGEGQGQQQTFMSSQAYTTEALTKQEDGQVVSQDFMSSRAFTTEAGEGQRQQQTVMSSQASTTQTLPKPEDLQMLPASTTETLPKLEDLQTVPGDSELPLQNQQQQYKEHWESVSIKAPENSRGDQGAWDFQQPMRWQENEELARDTDAHWPAEDAPIDDGEYADFWRSVSISAKRSRDRLAPTSWSSS